MDTTLVVAHHNESLHWIADVDKSKFKDVIVVSKTWREADIYQHVNKGFEASAYLLYIYEHYEELSNWTVFVHGHETSIHHLGRTQDLVNGIHFRWMYKNINHDHLTNDFVVDARMDWPGAGPGHRRDMKNGFNRTWLPHLDIFMPYVMQPKPRNFVTRRCAQFYVHKGLIMRHSRDLYKAWYMALMNETHRDGKHMAIAWEWAWCHIMTGYFDEYRMERELKLCEVDDNVLEFETVELDIDVDENGGGVKVYLRLLPKIVCIPQADLIV